MYCVRTKSDDVRYITYLLEMSSSWDFPARASPSCEGSEPSRAELGHFNFRAETELTIPTICMSKNRNFFLTHLSFYYQKFLSKKATCKYVVFSNQVI